MPKRSKRKSSDDIVSEIARHVDDLAPYVRAQQVMECVRQLDATHSKQSESAFIRLHRLVDFGAVTNRVYIWCYAIDYFVRH